MSGTIFRDGNSERCNIFGAGGGHMPATIHPDNIGVEFNEHFGKPCHEPRLIPTADSDAMRNHAALCRRRLKMEVLHFDPGVFKFRQRVECRFDGFRVCIHIQYLADRSKLESMAQDRKAGVGEVCAKLIKRAGYFGNQPNAVFTCDGYEDGFAHQKSIFRQLGLFRVLLPVIRQLVHPRPQKSSHPNRHSREQ